MAYVQRRGGSWRARYAGSDMKLRSRTFALKRDAERWANEMEVALARGEWLDPAKGKTTFDEWASRYFAESVHKRPTTLARDRTVTATHLSPALGGRPVASISPLDVRRIVDRMAERLAPATVRTNYGVLRAILSAAVESELIARTPCRGIKLPAARKKQIRFLSAVELQRLADAMPVEYRPMIYLAGVLGLRWSEVAGLRSGRIDFLRRTVEIAETVAEVNGRLLFADVKTDASRRTLSVPPFLVEMLAEHLSRRGAPDPSVLLFEAPGGGPLRATNFRTRVWAPAVRRADVQGLTFHGLRHSAVGLMIEVGAHIEAIKQRLGHSSIRVTSDVYGSLLPAVDASVTADLDGLFSKSRAHSAPIATSGSAAPTAE